jgi:lysophospholipase L1-like esterase
MTLPKYLSALSVLVLGMLGGSIMLNCLLYGQAKKYYLELNQTRLDPFGLNYYTENRQEVPDSQPLRVVFFGDSRATGWTSPSNMSGYEFFNRGVPSQTSAQIIQRFSYHVRPLNPDIVVIQVGINDLKTVALFPERKKAIVDDCQENIRQIVEQSKQLGAMVIITTIFPAGKVPLARRPFWSDDIAQAIEETNAYIATLANDKTLVLDTFSMLADSEGLMSQEYRIDELHLNEQGYKTLNLELVELLKSM